METTADPEEETMARMTSGEERGWSLYWHCMEIIILLNHIMLKFEYFLEKINKDHQV